MVVALDPAGSIASLRNALVRDSRLLVTVTSEPRYLASASGDMNRILRLVAYTIGSIMALGALFAALNATYSSVIRRATEMATMRAIGFSGSAVASALLAEALLLAFVGAVIGVVGAYCVFDGVTISTLGGAQFDAQLVYSLSISPTLLGSGVVLACSLGLAGGLLPAIGAGRANIPDLLQEI
jgi:putative ABC transport system permease protein